MAFRTKLDYSDNRQIKQREKTNTVLSGSTTFGVPYSALTNGLDKSTSGITENDFGIVLSTFSGNATSTIFTWYDPRMALAESQFSAITNSTSGVSQESGVIFVVDTTGITQDGYNYVSTYSGLSFSFTVNAIYSGAGPVFSGSVQSDDIEFYSASSLDYTGRTIWIDNPEITRTNRLIVTNNPSVGYVLTCDSVEGEATWSPVSAATSGATFWEEDGTGNGALKDVKGSHTINGLSDFSIIAGGESNTIDASVNSGILGGVNNNINNLSNRSAIIGGYLNTITSGHTDSLIAGGTGNTIHYGAIGNGEAIVASNDSSIMSSNTSTIISSRDSGITGNGFTNIFGGIESYIYGGNTNAFSGNLIMGVFGGVISGATGARRNMIGASTISYMIGNGSERLILGSGFSNLASGNNSSIISSVRSYVDTSTTSVILGSEGGIGNDVTITGGTSSSIISSSISKISNSTTSSILGGEDNFINDSDRSAIIGGSGNTVDGFFSSGIRGKNNVIIGGVKNTIDNGFERSVILGGQNITAKASDTVFMNNLYVTQTTKGILYTSINNVAGSLVSLSGSSKLPRFAISVGTGGVGTGSGGSIGVRAWDDVTYAAYGEPGDMHVYAGVSSNGLNLISADGSGGAADYVRIYAGKSANMGTADVHVQGTGVTQGYVGFDTESPTQRIDVNGNGRFRSIGSSASAGALHYTADGTLTTNTSDVRMKEQIITIDSALDKIKQLRGVYYKWKEDLERGVTGNTRVGFIAQEVEEVVPELAFTNERTEDKLMGVHYQDVTAILVEAIKELVSSGSPLFNRTELILETQTIAAEDNNIELNFNGTHDSALNGGITVIKGIDDKTNSEFVINSDGDWKTNNYILPHGLVLPEFTPTSTNDITGKLGEITRDDNYLYIKTSDGWKRTSLETF
jgi:hypothetical protein